MFDTASIFDTKRTGITGKITTLYSRRGLLRAVIGVAAVWSSLALLCSLDRIGDWFMNQTNYSAAVPFYQTMTAVASTVDPDHHRLADAWTNLGVCYEKLGEQYQADRAQRIALSFRATMSSR